MQRGQRHKIRRPTGRRVLPPPKPTYHPVDLAASAASPTGCQRKSIRRRSNGAMAVEFALVFLASLSLFGLAGEFFRISMIDQTLARVTHQSAEAVSGLPDGDVECENTIQRVFDRDVGARWLFDRNGDDTVNIVFSFGTTWPAVTLSDEIGVAISWDDDPQTSVDWSDATTGSCGGDGSWLRLRSRFAIQPWFGPVRPFWGAMYRQHESWGRNSRTF